MILFRWFLREYHESMIAFWETRVATARHERDWDCLEHARGKRDAHQDAVDRLVKAL